MTGLWYRITPKRSYRSRLSITFGEATQITDYQTAVAHKIHIAITFVFEVKQSLMVLRQICSESHWHNRSGRFCSRKSRRVLRGTLKCLATRAGFMSFCTAEYMLLLKQNVAEFTTISLSFIVLTISKDCGNWSPMFNEATGVRHSTGGNWSPGLTRNRHPMAVFGHLSSIV
jgi:hypothetical protein